ncbi:RodZ domain-containing protein [Shewanella surugensis]|uniref:DUF4115 domain-containing protein n=1 Tax=Shewanella surugensis TaxID=212020 RepID=A0ABT0LBW9_9GAMM|nr:RodZ domain-containing protein [Shewanella surugensis]MCL1125010.1 DUF4115 domain-containing protein [Shewanella surugensis]
MKKKHIELPNDGDNDEAVNKEPTLGEKLKSARETKGLSVAEVAQRLNLRPIIVEKIEADDFSELGGTTYVRGYVKNFARIVQADPDDIQACLNTILANDKQPNMQSFSRRTTRQARDGRLMLLTYLIAIVLLALLVWWWIQKSSMETELDISQPTVEEVAEGHQMLDQSTIDATQANAAAVNKDLMTLDNPLPATHSLSAVPSTSVNNDAANANNDIRVSTNGDNGAASAQSTLVFNLSGDCWVKVTDETGKVLTSGLKQANDTVSLSGQAPFAVLLGAPQSVTVSFNDQNVNLASFPSGKVARLTIPLGE